MRVWSKADWVDPAYGWRPLPVFSTLLRCTFDEALPHFGDGSVDLLQRAIIARYDALYSGFLAQDSDEHQTDGQPRGAGLEVGWTRRYGP